MNSNDQLSAEIAKTAKVFSDPKRVSAILSLLESPNSSAIEMIGCEGQDFSTATKRLKWLEDRGLLYSKRLPNRRIYSVVGQQRTADLMNAILRFGRELRR